MWCRRMLSLVVLGLVAVVTLGPRMAVAASAGTMLAQVVAATDAAAWCTR